MFQRGAIGHVVEDDQAADLSRLFGNQRSNGNIQNRLASVLFQIELVDIVDTAFATQLTQSEDKVALEEVA